MVHLRQPSPAALMLVLAFAASCNSAPGDVREWTAADHDQPEGRARQVAARPSSERASDAPDEDLVDLAWQRSCIRCHGPEGRGDGQEGPMVRAPDLTREEWQARVTDDDIALTIRKGRNKMPAFDLPPPVIVGLVARIRARRARP